jgi:hypothetical protein
LALGLELGVGVGHFRSACSAAEARPADRIVDITARLPDDRKALGKRLE